MTGRPRAERAGLFLVLVCGPDALITVIFLSWFRRRCTQTDRGVMGDMLRALGPGFGHLPISSPSVPYTGVQGRLCDPRHVVSPGDEAGSHSA